MKINDTAMKIIVFSGVGLIVLWLIKSTFLPTGYGMSLSYNTPGYFRNGMEHSYNSNYGFSFTSLIIQMLLVVIIISLIIGVVILVKNFVVRPEEIVTTKESVPENLIQDNSSCVQCGKELNQEWKVCPHCGKEIVSLDSNIK
ncbi:MAG: zinc ribbon domain-containing protein [Thermotaleaceae bacterium]